MVAARIRARNIMAKATHAEIKKLRQRIQELKRQRNGWHSGYDDVIGRLWLFLDEFNHNPELQQKIRTTYFGAHLRGERPKNKQAQKNL